jgi:sensor domain CHASE-containing protein
MSRTGSVPPPQHRRTKKLADELGIAATSEEKVTTGAGEIKVKGANIWIKIRDRDFTPSVSLSALHSTP